MISKLVLSLLVLGSALGATVIERAYADDWVMIGQRKVSDRVETDTISLQGHRTYEKLKICVYRNPVSFKDLDVYFENGGHQDVSVARRINAGECTRVIDLKGDERDLDRIVLRYEETSRRRARATVRVFARL